MPGFMDNFTFGGASVDFKGKATATEHFLGAVFAEDAQIKTSVTDAKGLDFGSNEGYYKDYAAIRIQRMDKFADANLENVEITVYDSADNKSFAAACKLIIPKDKLNLANRTPYLLHVPSGIRRYVAMSVKFTVASGKTLATLTGGSFIAQMTPSRW